MNSYMARKLAIFLGSLMILIPCVLLLAWESRIPNVIVYWGILTLCSGMLLAAIYAYERRHGMDSFRKFIGKCGGFCIMFVFILYRFAELLFA